MGQNALFILLIQQKNLLILGIHWMIQMELTKYK